MDHDDELSFRGAVFEMLDEVGSFATKIFFEFFRQFASEDNLALRHDGGEVVEEFGDAIRGFVEDERGVEGF